MSPTFRACVKFEPRNKAELVAAVATSTRGPRSLGAAVATNDSLSIAVVSDYVVDVSNLQIHLSERRGAGTAPLASSRLRDGGSGFLSSVRQRRTWEMEGGAISCQRAV